MSKHHAEVIEIYPGEGKAAVRFSYKGRERIECVQLYSGPDCETLICGMQGWATYMHTPSYGMWVFTPYKTKGVLV